VVYRYSVSAVDRAGNEGQPSESRSTSTFSRPAVVPPTNLRLQEEPGGPRLAWDAPKDAAGFVVYVAAARDRDYRQFGTLAREASVAVTRPPEGEEWYRVQAVYAAGAVSELSEPIAVKSEKGR
jgi:hypothetical protein